MNLDEEIKRAKAEEARQTEPYYVGYWRGYRHAIQQVKVAPSISDIPGE